MNLAQIGGSDWIQGVEHIGVAALCISLLWLGSKATFVFGWVHAASEKRHDEDRKDWAERLAREQQDKRAWAQIALELAQTVQQKQVVNAQLVSQVLGGEKVSNDESRIAANSPIFPK